MARLYLPTDSALYRVSAAGGAPTPLTTLDASRKEIFHAHPRFLPDGRHFLYLANSSQRENTGIMIGSLDSKETKPLLNTDNSNAAYAPPGYLLFLRERTLMAQSFDASKLELAGDPFPLAEEVDRITGAAFGLFSVSETGALIYGSGNTGDVELAWFDRSGKQFGTVGPPAVYFTPFLSPDEKRLAITRDDLKGSTADVWLIDLARGIPTRFTFNGINIWPIWSPDGRRVVFASNRDGQMNLYQRAASGEGNDEGLLKTDYRKLPNDWSMDGKFILYQTMDSKAQYDLWILTPSENREPFPFLQTDFSEHQGRFSPRREMDRIHLECIRDVAGLCPDLSGCWRQAGRSQLLAGRNLCGVAMRVNCSTFLPTES